MFRYEFTVAMHLVYRALQGDMIPDQVRHVVGGGGCGSGSVFIFLPGSGSRFRREKLREKKLR